VTFDKAHWHLRGPVRSMRSEVAQWDPARHSWADRTFSQAATFDEQGHVTVLDQRGPEQSTARTLTTYDERGRPLQSQSGIVGGAAGVTHTWRYDERGRLAGMTVKGTDGTVHRGEEWSYDDSGRKSRKTALGGGNVDGYFVEDTNCAYAAHGAVQQTTYYDEQGRVMEVDFVDANGSVVQHVVFERDALGHIVSEEGRMAGAASLPPQPGMSDEDFQTFQGLVAYAFGSIRTTYEYDTDGRRISEVRQMGRLAEHRSTFRYDERGNLLEKRDHHVDRQMDFDEAGTPHQSPDSIRVYQVRVSYTYDAQGNWTEQIFHYRTSEDGDYQPSHAEWRTIEYW